MSSRPTETARDALLFIEDRSSPPRSTARVRTAAHRLVGDIPGAELKSFEVDFTSAGNMRVDVRSKDHHNDLVIATSLALWSGVGKPSGKVEVGQFENWY